MNLCILKESHYVDTYQTLMASNGMDQLINSVTRGNSCLDHIYFRSRDKIKYKSSVLFSGRSDHSVVVCELEINANKRNSQNSVLETEKIDYKLLKSLVREIDWSNVFSSKKVSEAFTIFLHLLQTVIKKSKYTQTRQVKFKLLKPWMTEQLCRRQVYRNILYKKSKNRVGDRRFQRFFQSYSQKLKIDMEEQKKKIIIICSNRIKKI